MKRPSIARTYDFFRGGAKNNASDRALGQRVLRIIPEARQLTAVNSAFQARAAKFALAQGIDQIIDVGAGTASIWSTHHAAHAVNPACRVLYVDNEAVAVEDLRAAIGDDRRLGVLRADVREPEAILAAAHASGLIDVSRPLIIVMGLLLHFIPDEHDPVGLLTRWREALASGSYLVISHDTPDGREADVAGLVELYASTNRPLTVRSRAALAELLAGYELIEPGIVHAPLWRPSPDDPPFAPAEKSCMYAVVGKT